MFDADFKEPEENGTPPKKRRWPTILIAVLIAIVMGAGGFFAGKILSGGKQINNTAQTGDSKTVGETPGRYSGEEPGGETGGEIGERTEKKGRQGLLSLETFTVNLNDPFGKRYAECDLNLVLNDRNLVPSIKANALVMAKIRHEIFMTISAKSYSDLKSTAGKITLFEEVQMRVNEILKEQLGVEPVLEVLQTRFLMQ
jgi:flagellar basal body-associated protein FliL